MIFILDMRVIVGFEVLVERCELSRSPLNVGSKDSQKRVDLRV